MSHKKLLTNIVFLLIIIALAFSAIAAAPASALEVNWTGVNSTNWSVAQGGQKC